MVFNFSGGSFYDCSEGALSNGNGFKYVNHGKKINNFRKLINCNIKWPQIDTWDEHASNFVNNKASFFPITRDIVWFTLLLLFAIGLLNKRQSKLHLFLNICMAGTFLFLILFEARPRYIFSYLPIILILAANAFTFIQNRPKKAELKQ
jgi:hypothetical protein